MLKIKFVFIVWTISLYGFSCNYIQFNHQGQMGFFFVETKQDKYAKVGVLHIFICRTANSHSQFWWLVVFHELTQNIPHCHIRLPSNNMETCWMVIWRITSNHRFLDVTWLDVTDVLVPHYCLCINCLFNSSTFRHAIVNWQSMWIAPTHGSTHITMYSYRALVDDIIVAIINVTS